MPIIDLSQVTEVLIRLLERYISQPLISHLVTSNTLITGDPPDMLAGHDSDYALSLYLYHVREDEYHKNQIELSSCDTPLRYQEAGSESLLSSDCFWGAKQWCRSTCQPLCSGTDLDGPGHESVS